jgi:Holliday junction resolvasome RuvABC endonuclease subunit
MKYVLYLDPSLRYFGLSVIGWPINTKRKPRLVYTECVATKRNARGLVRDSDLANLDQIAQALEGVFNTYRIHRVVVEAFVGSKSSTAAKALAFVQGLIVGVCVAHEVPRTYYTAMDVKKKLTGVRVAEKDDVLQGALKMFPELQTFIEGKKKEIQYAMADSCALFVCE